VVAAVVVLALISRHNITQLEVIIFCVLVPSLVVHEVAHGWVALACGDDTARRAGRLSLNPVRHVDVVGTLIVPAVTVLAGWGFLGWAKPVPVDLSKLRSPRNQGVLVALAGPGINVVVAVLAGVAFRVLFSHGSGNLGLAAQVVFYLSLLNLWVACFNLVPLPPLDGSVLVERLLPAAWWPGYLRIRPYTLPVLFGAILLLSWANVYPLGAVFNHLQDWWAQQLGVTLTSAPVS
jgi:Zn-dependent protease